MVMVAAMPQPAFTQLIPFSELAPGQAGTIRNELVKAMAAQASRELNLVSSKLVVRDIRVKDDLVVYSVAADADIEDWSAVSGTTANTYENLANGTMADQRYVGFYGVKTSEESVVTAIKFSVGGAEKAIWQLQGLSKYDDYVGLTPGILVIPQNIVYTISRFVRIASNNAFVVLKGLVVEPRGKVLSP